MIQKCTCQHDYQDSVYGKNNRVHNPTGKATEIRCTVCNKNNQTKSETIIKEKKNA